MASPSRKKTSPNRSEPSKRGSNWIWVGLFLVVILAVAVLVYQTRQQERFEIVSGENEVLVLLRGERSSDYRLRYTGREPVDLTSLQVMLAGQVLHVDVRPATLVKDGEETQLQPPGGTLPPGTIFRLEPDDEFDVRVTYLGQTLGGNYLYGFKIGYTQDGRERSEDLVMEYDYEVIVQ